MLVASSGVGWGTLLDGLIPVVGIAIGTAVINVIGKKARTKKEAEEAAAQKIKDEAEKAAQKIKDDALLEVQERAQLINDVRDMQEFIRGTPAKGFKKAVPGLQERFDTLENNVGVMSSYFEQVAPKLDQLLKNGNGHA